MAKLGFLGLGIMGAPMARHLVEAGHDVALWSHSPGKTKRIASPGAVSCVTPAEVAQRSERVFLCVGNTAMSQQVILGHQGLAEGASSGLVIVDCSTISPSASRRIGSELLTRGIHFLDAPCTGSKAGAEAAALTFMVGGDANIYERVRPYLNAMGTLLYYCGGPGKGLQVKLSQNLVIGTLLQAFNESLVLSTKAGIAPDLMLEVLNNSAAKSGLIAAKAPAVFRRDFSTSFSVKWLEKDMKLMLESAEELNVPTPLTSLSRQLYRAAIAQGYGEDDVCGSIRVLEQIVGCKVTVALAQTENTANSLQPQEEPEK